MDHIDQWIENEDAMTHDEMDTQISADIAAQEAEVERLSKVLDQAMLDDPQFDPTNSYNMKDYGPAFQTALENWYQAHKIWRLMTDGFTAAELTLFRAHHLDPQNLPW